MEHMVYCSSGNPLPFSEQNAFIGSGAIVQVFVAELQMQRQDLPYTQPPERCSKCTISAILPIVDEQI